MRSTITKLGAVPFPAFTAERVYMRPFFKRNGLPPNLARWQPTVDAMLAGIETDGPIYLMVDQKNIVAGNSHRRPGIHVDMYWHPAISAHRGEPPGHRPSPAPAPTPERHSPRPTHMRSTGAESIILASDVLGCRGFIGDYEGEIGYGGDCSHLDLSGLQAVNLTPGYAWGGHAMHMLHESLHLARNCQRTVVRLNVPGVEI